MKPIATLVVVLTLLVPGLAFAQPGINLAWDDCLGGGGVLDKTRICTNSPLTPNNLHQSFILPAPIGALSSSDALMDVQIDSPALPPWWTSSTRWSMALGPSACVGWFDGAPSGGVAFGPSVTQVGPTRIRLRTAVVVSAGEERPANAGTEYLADVIDLRFTAGTAVDPGCAAPACVVLNQITLVDVANPANPITTILTTPSTSNYVTWQSYALACPFPTPTKKATWGSIKALYR